MRLRDAAWGIGAISSSQRATMAVISDGAMSNRALLDPGVLGSGRQRRHGHAATGSIGRVPSDFSICEQTTRLTTTSSRGA